MSKKTILLIAPLEHRSGFGEHARDIYEKIKEGYDMCLLNINAYDPVISTGYKYVTRDEIKKEYDVLMTVCTIDNMHALNFAAGNKIKFNKKINISAGIESYKVTPQWAEAAVYYDSIITSSEHSKQTFIAAGVDESKLFVVPEGIDLERYFKDDSEPLFPLPVDKKIILTAGQIGLGGPEEERKGIWLLIREFYKEFKEDSDVLLVAKIRHMNYNSGDLEEIENKVKLFKKDSKASVLIVHGELSLEEFRKLYSHPSVKACAYPTCGEGYGRHIIESAACEKLIIAPWKTGQKDFLLQDCILELDSERKPVADVYKMNMPIFFGADAEWENVVPSSLRKTLRKAIEEDAPQEKIKKQYNFIKSNHETKACFDLFEKTIEDITKEVKEDEES